MPTGSCHQRWLRTSLTSRERPPSRVGRRPSSLVRAWFNPVTSWQRRKGAKRSGVGNPGAMTSRCSADEAPGHLVCMSSVGRCSGVSIRVAHRISACERTSSTDEWKLLEQGPEVSLLLRFAQVECRLSSAPPISMHLLCAGWAGLPIRVKAHCLCGPTHRKFERRARCGTAKTGRQTLRT